MKNLERSKEGSLIHYLMILLNHNTVLQNKEIQIGKVLSQQVVTFVNFKALVDF